MKTIDIINDSGYPLQILVEHLERTNRHLDWDILVKEHFWFDSVTQDQGFIDIVLGSLRYPVRVIIECKRVTGSWNFITLPPSFNSCVTRLLFADRESDEKPWNIRWKELNFNPSCMDSAFCVMETEGKKDNRTLEKYSGELLNALENFARNELGIGQIKIMPIPNLALPNLDAMFYMPVIVTTATLQRCIVYPDTIGVDNGKINEENFTPVPYIRFRKNLPSKLTVDNIKITNIRDMNLANERVIYVVQANQLLEFLSKFSN